METKDLVSEMDASLGQQRREWLIQRVAWFFLYALLLGVMFGLLGEGPLSTSVAASPDGALRVEYDRFVRRHSPDSLDVTLRAMAETVELKLDSQYVRHIQIEHVTPAPERVVATDDSLTFVFNTRAGSLMRASIEYRPEGVGSLQGWVSATGQPRQPFSQFIYP